MENIILIIKSFIVGIGKIIPGVSGSLMAISFGIYEDVINSVNNLRKNFLSNFKYLCKVGIGFLLAVVFGSKILLYFFDNYYVYTFALFIGLIFGSFYTILDDIKINKIKDIFIILISCFVLFFFKYFSADLLFVPSISLSSLSYISLLGFIDAATMIIPGISGTAIFIMLGSYNFVLSMYSDPLGNLLYFIIYGLGLLIGVILVSKFIAFALKKHKKTLYLCIFGFAIYTVYFLIVELIPYLVGSSIILIIFLFLLGSFISKKIG